MPLHLIATVALAPVLVAQGRRVRRTTPRLPEAAGAREGLAHCATSPPAAIAPMAAPFRLLIAGDSSAAGVGVDTQAQALSGLLPTRLAQALGRPVTWRLVARTGAMIDDLTALLHAIPVQPFDAAVIAIGVNEVTARTPQKLWRARLDALATLLRTRFELPAIVFSALPPMHLFPALPQPLRWYLGTQARRLDATLARWADEQAPKGVRRIAIDLGAQDASARRAGGGDALVASDGFHPGPRAYRAWAEGLAAAMAAAADTTQPHRTTTDQKKPSLLSL